jgi:hypothetical protein
MASPGACRPKLDAVACIDRVLPAEQVVPRAEHRRHWLDKHTCLEPPKAREVANLRWDSPNQSIVLQLDLHKSAHGTVGTPRASALALAQTVLSGSTLTGLPVEHLDAGTHTECIVEYTRAGDAHEAAAAQHEVFK